MEMAAVQTGEIADFALDVSAAEAVLGGGLPAKAEQHLNLAGLAYQDDALAEQHLREAQSLAPEHVAVLIGLYRFYFYKGRLADALGVAEICLDKAARANGLPLDWRRVRPGDADFSSFEAILPRFTTRERGNGLVTRPLVGIRSRRDISAILRPDRFERPSVRVVIQALRETARAVADTHGGV